MTFIAKSPTWQIGARPDGPDEFESSLRVGGSVFDQRCAPRIDLRLHNPADVACCQHVPVPRADHHDGPAPGGVWKSRQTPVSEIQKRLFPWQIVGLVITSLSGFLLFYSQPTRYYGKALFWLKLVLMVLAGDECARLSCDDLPLGGPKWNHGQDTAVWRQACRGFCRWCCGRASSCSGGSLRITGSRTNKTYVPTAVFPVDGGPPPHRVPACDAMVRRDDQRHAHARRWSCLPAGS